MNKGTLIVNGIDYSNGGGGSSINVVDNLETESSIDALSAKQGKILNEKVNPLTSRIEVRDYVNYSLSLEQCITNLVTELATLNKRSYVMSTIGCDSGTYFGLYYVDNLVNGMGFVAQFGSASYSFYVASGNTAVLKAL